MSDKDINQDLSQAIDEVELEELTEEGGAATLGTASTAGCPSTLGTFGSH